MDSIVIVGAGTFGASLAWWLARNGTQVTLVDRYTPGDPRATSGGESRLIRSGHGDHALYTRLARRAYALWSELQDECQEELLVQSGTAWFARRPDGFEAASIATLTAESIPHERLDPSAGERLFPSFDPTGIEFILFEPEAGALRAARAVGALARRAVAHGATLLHAEASPDGERVRLDDGQTLAADVVVWACGTWLGQLFPQHTPIRSTRQELYFFDGGSAWREPSVPCYVEYDAAIYGTRDLDEIGVKAAPDFDGPPLDPDADLPPASAEGERATRAFLAARFPALADAPLSASKTCRYELSIDSHFIAARHPEHENTWLLGGGSGHGFKHGPAVAERLAAALAGGAPMPAEFGLGERGETAGLRTSGAGRAG